MFTDYFKVDIYTFSIIIMKNMKKDYSFAQLHLPAVHFFLLCVEVSSLCKKQHQSPVMAGFHLP